VAASKRVQAAEPFLMLGRADGSAVPGEGKRDCSRAASAPNDAGDSGGAGGLRGMYPTAVSVPEPGRVSLLAHLFPEGVF
jgi:hypothetical protein